MEYRPLGTSEVKVSAITLGAWAIGGFMWGGTDEKDAIAAIQRSIDLGVTTIDTAPIYGMGYSEELVGKAIKGRRDQVQLLTKFGLDWEERPGGTAYFQMPDPQGRVIKVNKNSRREQVIRECERSLKLLGVEAIDLYQHHWPDPGAPLEETFAAVDQLLREGKIRAAGVSNYPVETLEAVSKLIPLASDQPPYSMVNRDIERDVLPWCRAHNLGVIVYSPLQRGLLTGKITMETTFPETDHRANEKFFQPEMRRQALALLEQIKPIAERHQATLGQLVIAWTIRQPGITAALVGARNARQAEENARAAELALSAEEIQTIDNLVRTEA